MQRIIKYLDFIIYWFIVFIPFSISIAPAPMNVFIGVLIFCYLVKKILKKEGFFVRTPIDLPFFFLVVISVISMINSIDYLDSLKGILKLVKFYFIFLIFAEELRDRLHVKRIVLALILGACFASFDAVWQIIFGKDFVRLNRPIVHIGNLKRATAAFPHPNSLGIYLAPTLSLPFALALYYLKGKKRMLMFMAGMLILTGITLTYSRPAGLASFLSLLLLVILKKDKILITIFILFLVIIPFIAPRDIKNWAKGVNYNPIILMCNYDRISMYKNTMNMIKHHPLIGVGVNTFSRNYSLYKLPEAPRAITESSTYAHNNFLHMAGEIGLLGLSVFIWLLVALYKICIYNYKKIHDPFLKIISLSLSLSLFAFLVNGLTETNLYNSRLSPIFWYAVGFCLALNRLYTLKKIL